MANLGADELTDPLPILTMSERKRSALPGAMRCHRQRVLCMRSPLSATEHDHIRTSCPLSAKEHDHIPANIICAWPWRTDLAGGRLRHQGRRMRWLPCRRHAQRGGEHAGQADVASCQLPGYPGPLRLFSKFSFKIPSAATLRWQRSFSCRERVAVPVRDVHAATPRRHSKLRGTCPAAIRCVRRQSPVCTDACGRIQPSAGPAVRPRWRSPVVSPNVWGAEPEPVRTAAALSPYGLHTAAVPAAVSAAVPNLVPESPAGQSVPLCSDSWSAAVPALQV